MNHSGVQPSFTASPQLHAAITDFERQKLEAEQRHSKQLQRVLDETSARMGKMEAEYTTQTRANVSGKETVLLATSLVLPPVVLDCYMTV